MDMFPYISEKDALSKILHDGFAKSFPVPVSKKRAVGVPGSDRDNSKDLESLRVVFTWIVDAEAELALPGAITHMYRLPKNSVVYAGFYAYVNELSSNGYLTSEMINRWNNVLM